MVNRDEILRCLNNDEWFTPNNSGIKATIKDVDGKDMQVPESYYHKYENNGQILIRVSDHGTYLRTWIGRKSNPADSLQNLSVVFSQEPVTFSRKLLSRRSDRTGENTNKDIFFVVEQYEYNINKISAKDFLKIIKKIKNLELYGVFNDPLKKKPSKKANRRVITPSDENDNDIPRSNNPVHARQMTVVNNPEREVDANNNIIEARFQELIQKCIDGYLRRVL